VPVILACDAHADLDGLEATPRIVILRATGEPHSFVADFPYPVVPVAGHPGRFWVGVCCDGCRWELPAETIARLTAERDEARRKLADALANDGGLDR